MYLDFDFEVRTLRARVVTPRGDFVTSGTWSLDYIANVTTRLALPRGRELWLWFDGESAVSGFWGVHVPGSD